jgi:1-acyl-sn-glycerol-3-phosphate acyltransferase
VAEPETLRSRRKAVEPGRFRHVRFADVLERGPGLAERVNGSAGLRRRQLQAYRLCRLFGRMEVTGLGRVPEIGPAILAVNHTSLMDGPVLFGLLRRPVSFLVKAEAFEPGRGWAGDVLRSAGQLPVRRYQVDPAPVRYALALLNAGGILGMFPEGSRGSGLAEAVRPGVGYFAVKSGAPVLPVAVLGTRTMIRYPYQYLVTVRIGPPLSFPAPSGVLNRGRWLEAAELIRQAMAELVAADPADLPPAVRIRGTTMEP